jgi:undecaprenyl-diphosphatase
MSWSHAFKIGGAQCIALVPGMSRAGATIVGGLIVGLSRTAATEFSFFLAVPTLFAAGVYQLYKDRALMSGDDLGWFSIGLLASFVSAYLCIRWLLRYVSTHDFTAFAWYRIVFGVIVIVTTATGSVSWSGR